MITLHIYCHHCATLTAHKHDSVSEHLNSSCTSSKSPQAAVGGLILSQLDTASKVQLDTSSDCSRCYSPRLHSTPNKTNTVYNQTLAAQADINLSNISRSLSTTVNERPIKGKNICYFWKISCILKTLKYFRLSFIINFWSFFTHWRKINYAFN